MTPQMKGAVVAVLVVSPLTAAMAATVGPEALLPAVAVLVAAKIANLSHGGDRKSDQGANLHLEPVTRARAAELLNLHRRHLDESQRAKVAAKIANLQNGQKASSANLQSTGVSQSRAAELLNVGTRTVAAAKGRKEER